MPAKPTGVYPDGRVGWYLKLRLEPDPVTGRREQITKRGFLTAAEAGTARHALVDKMDRVQPRSTPVGITVSDLLDLYLDGLDADGHLSAKTRFDYRHSAEDYVRPRLGHLWMRRDSTVRSLTR